VNNTVNLKNSNVKIRKGRWFNFSYYVKNRIHKIRNKLLDLFIGLENSKEYDPGNLGVHNTKMLLERGYKFAYYYKCVIHRMRFDFLNFLVDLIMAILLIISFVIFSAVLGLITFMAMLVLVF
jgi:hypothetical protein